MFRNLYFAATFVSSCAILGPAMYQGAHSAPLPSHADSVLTPLVEPARDGGGRGGGHAGGGGRSIGAIGGGRGGSGGGFGSGGSGGGRPHFGGGFGQRHFGGLGEGRVIGRIGGFGRDGSGSGSFGGPGGGYGAGRQFGGPGGGDGMDPRPSNRVIGVIGPGHSVRRSGDFGPGSAWGGYSARNHKRPPFAGESHSDRRRPIAAAHWKKRRDHRYTRHYWWPGAGLAFYGLYGTGYAYEDCEWLKEVALETDSAYWWDRYELCQYPE